MLEIKRITASNFKPFGWVIEFPRATRASKTKNLFRIVLKESKPLGWRIAYLIIRDKIINKLEQHPDSYESFEPVKGASLLFVSNAVNFKNTVCFKLDKPIILKKGIWHGIVCKGQESEVKITENARVKCVYRELEAGRGKCNR